MNKNAAIVLAGGRSSRLGRDKTALDFGGRTLLSRTVAGLADHFDTVVVSLGAQSRRPGELDELDKLPAETIVAKDIFEGRGPLGGIHAAMTAVEAEYYFAAACDMPFLDPRLGLAMLDHAARGGFDVVIPRTPDGRTHPLHAVYGHSCLPHIQRQLEDNMNKIIMFFDKVHVRYFERDDIVEIDPQMLSFFNINTEKDLERARRIDDERWM